MCRLALMALTALCLLTPPAADAATAKRPPLAFFTNSEHGISELPPYRDPFKGYYESPRGSLNIVDARTTTRRVIVIPDRCEGHGIALPVLLLLCEDSPTARVWDSWTGEVTPVDVAACGGYARSISLGGIGRHWIAGQYHTGTFDHEYGNEFVRPVYINRQTGECKVFVDDSDLNRDLDRESLPKRRYVPGKCGDGRKYVVRRTARRVHVKRCAHGARWRLVCRRSCDPLGGRNLLAWVDGTRLRVYVVAPGRRLSWGIPGDPGPYEAYPTVLRDRVYVNVLIDYPPVATYAADLSGLVRP
jgi:hypothetical protein